MVHDRSESDADPPRGARGGGPREARVRYEGVVYRPPSEAGSLIPQATLGCPHNKCAFCGMYKERRFRERPLEELIEDLDIALGRYGPHRVRSIFLADGNTAVLPTEKLVAIGEAAKSRFPQLQRITTLFSDHVSNFLDVRGRIPDDKPAMLAAIDEALERPITAFRPPTERLVGLGL